MKHLKSFNIDCLDQLKDFFKSNRSVNRISLTKEKMLICSNSGITLERQLEALRPIVVDEFTKYATQIIMSDEPIGLLVTKMNGYISLGFSPSDISSSISPLISRVIPVFVRSVINLNTAPDEIGARFNVLEEIGFKRHELVGMIKGIVYSYIDNYSRHALNSDNIKGIKTKIDSFVVKVGVSRSDMIEVVNGPALSNMREFIKKRDHQQPTVMFLKRLSDRKNELGPLVNSPRELLDMYYGVLIKLLPEIGDNEELLKRAGVNLQDLFNEGVTAGVICNYDELLGAYPRVKLDPELLERAKKLTKASKLLRRK